ncbi:MULTISPECIES: site-specific integrase [Paenibacillus]|uniref:site-specific integrase n=1 Tax=Paenibacillus TaxID=44249 RepID=UPI0022B88883|nr:site-specific integrase [Paenibacillus caseinilyticus]MCZ8520142.1 site-specific integrase [Paenibacillus caseinilyticus]
MNIVQPIRDPDKIIDIKRYLRESNKRNYIMFLVGINTGLRISDILKLRVGDVQGGTISIREQKTRKQKRFMINPALRKELQEYTSGMQADEYLFPSRQGMKQAIGRSTAYKMLRKVARMFGLEEIGCHTLRKTFGYHFYNKTRDVALLMDIFNHSDPSITLRYIGINQDAVDRSMGSFRL